MSSAVLYVSHCTLSFTSQPQASWICRALGVSSASTCFFLSRSGLPARAGAEQAQQSATTSDHGVLRADMWASLRIDFAKHRVGAALPCTNALWREVVFH